MIQVFTLRIQEGEAAESQVPSQPVLEILLQKEKGRKEGRAAEEEKIGFF